MNSSRASFDSEGKALSRTGAYRRAYYKRKAVSTLPTNITIDKNLETILNFISTNEQTAMPKRNAMNVIRSLKNDCRRSDKLN